MGASADNSGISRGMVRVGRSVPTSNRGRSQPFRLPSVHGTQRRGASPGRERPRPSALLRQVRPEVLHQPSRSLLDFVIAEF
jgi:hypothetical protein